MNDPEYWITAQQVAARVALTPATIKKWANEGKITAYKIGKSVRFKASDVD
uniref:helix-turn-helix domain-containing protein n=2 Tax=Bacteria TaxID=2 RepID=UPI0018B096CC